MPRGSVQNDPEKTAAGAQARRLDFSYGPDARIPTRNRYGEVFAGHKRPGRLVVAWILPGTGRASRLGPIAAKRTFRLATERNRARRLMREAFRYLRPEFTAGPWDIVLVARRGMLTASEPDVRRDLRRVFAAEGLLPRPSGARRVSAPPNNLSVPPGTPRGRGTAGDSRDA